MKTYELTEQVNKKIDKMEDEVKKLLEDAEGEEVEHLEAIYAMIQEYGADIDYIIYKFRTELEQTLNTIR